MDEIAAKQFVIIENLENELQQQKGMLWVLGEIMKVANNISSFKDLMRNITDMLMGVTGVTTCYLWAYNNENLKVYFRSTELQNKFRQLGEKSIPSVLKALNGTHVFSKEEITSPLIQEIDIPGSRLAVPLMNFSENTLLGVLVLEHQEIDFFTPNKIIFFETLGIFIASNTKNSRLFQTVTEESETDPLTGTFNRRYLRKVLDELIHKHDKMTVGIIDTDNFKLVNDFQGHIKGDEVLKAIADAAQNFLRDEGGKIVRYGGDEFVLLVPKSIRDVLPMFLKFQEIIPSLPSIAKLNIPITITMGVCSYPEMTLNPSILVQVADNALIRGKQEGKNRVIIATKEDLEKIMED